MILKNRPQKERGTKTIKNLAEIMQEVLAQLSYMMNLKFLPLLLGENLTVPLLDFVREGDTIYVHDFSRLARSTKDLLNITEILAKKKVDLVSFKENIDTSTPTGKLMLTMIGAINEFERTNLLERQKEGIFIAKELGKYKGRKPIPFPENWETIYPSWKNREMTGVAAMKLLKLKRCTFYKLIKDWEERENSKT